MYPDAATTKKVHPAVKNLAEVIGRELEWVQPSAWKMEYELRTGDETIATLRFRSSFGSFVRAESAVMFGWYLAVMMHMDSAVTVAGIS